MIAANPAAREKMSTVRITDNSKLVAAARTVVLLGSVLPFLGILGHGFIAVDDQIHTYLNPFLNGRAAGSVWNFWSSAYWGLYMPVTYTIWACISALARSGTTWNALPYHSANLALHALNGLLAF
jgi:hypothetical protein